MNRIAAFVDRRPRAAAVAVEDPARQADGVALRLVELARQVKRFALTYPPLFAEAGNEEQRRRYRFFLDTTRNLAASVDHLWGLACKTPGLTRLNREQLEAQVEEIRDLVAALPA